MPDFAQLHNHCIDTASLLSLAPLSPLNPFVFTTCQVRATTTQNPDGSEGQSNNTIYSILLTLSKLLHPCCTSLPTAMMLTSYLVRINFLSTDELT